MEIKSTSNSQSVSYKKGTFSSLEIDRAKKELKENPCLSVQLPVYEGVPEYIQESIRRKNDLYEQAKNSIDVFA